MGPPPTRYPVVDGKKQCSVCKIVKPLEDFSVQTAHKSGRSAGCKACRAASLRARWATDPKMRERDREYQRQWIAENREYYLERKREYSQKNWTHIVNRRRQRLYGMSNADYDAIFESQGGLCAICKTTEDVRLHIDHDHITGSVRGLLCGKCNRALGMMQDSPEIAMAASVYLQTRTPAFKKLLERS